MRKIFLICMIFQVIFQNIYSQYPKYLYGIASWYGDEFNGKITASGVVYNSLDYTAAHRTLPFGTEVEVENLENGNKCRVVITDRGPNVDSRIIDVSKQAASELGIINKGTAYVRVTIIKIGNGKVESIKSAGISSTKTQKPLTETKSISTTPSITSSITELPKTENLKVTEDKIITRTNQIVENIMVTNIVSYKITNTIKLTNYVDITNFIILTKEITNYYNIEITNQITLPPYEEKLVEKDYDNALAVENYDELFITDEPSSDLLIPPANQANYEKNFIFYPPLISDNNIVVTEKKEEKGEIKDKFNSFDSKIKIKQDEAYIRALLTKKNETTNINSNIIIPVINESLLANFEIPEDEIDIKDTFSNMIEIPKIDSNITKKNTKPISNNDVQIVREQDVLLPLSIDAINTNTQKANTNKVLVKEENYNYTIQIGAYKKEANALSVYNKLLSKGYNVFLSESVGANKERLIRVRVGNFTNREDLDRVVEELKKMKLDAYVIKIPK